MSETEVCRHRIPIGVRLEPAKMENGQYSQRVVYSMCPWCLQEDASFAEKLMCLASSRDDP
jgi:hypothetical protein